jgi:hypothetical protein
MANLRSRDMMTVDDLFIKDGYVLKFSDATYATFFHEELGINIDDPKYSARAARRASAYVISSVP